MIAVGCACFVLVVAGLAWLLGSPRLGILQVVVNGAESIPADQLVAKINGELDSRRLLFFHQRNRFLFDEAGLRAALSSTYSFESLSIERSCTLFGPGGCLLQVTVKEKTSQLLWKSGDRTYLADLQGVVTRELASEETEPLGRLPLLSDMNASPVVVGSSIASPEEISGIFLFHQRLRDEGISFHATGIDRMVGKWTAVETDAGYRILFDPVGDVTSQADHLNILLRDTVKDPSKLEYIDLRFGDHIYYK